MSDFHVHVRRAVKALKGQAKLATAIGRSQSEVHRLCTSALTISPDVAIAISQATAGTEDEVSIHDLLPDLARAVRREIEAKPMAGAA